MSDDKIYIIIIMVMIGFFVYWYQKRIENARCQKCIRRSNKRNKLSHSKSSSGKLSSGKSSSGKSSSGKLRHRKLSHHKSSKKKSSDHKKDNNIINPIIKSVKFKDNDTDVSLESLDSSDHLGSVSNNDENDSKSCDTIDI